MQNCENGQKNTDPFDVIRLVNKMHGIIHTQLIFVAAKLGIADLLTDGCKSIEDLAKATGTIEDRLYRTLRVLASIGIFTESPPRHFELTSLAEPLRTDSAVSVRDTAIMLGSEWHARAWTNILHCLENRESAFEGVYKTSLFDYLQCHPEDEAGFNATMSITTQKQVDAICRAYDFPDVGTVVDVGGGQGTLLSHVLKTHPNLRGILFDQASVIASARLFIESEGLKECCQFEEGSFFNNVPQTGSLYLLKYIIHDYDDDDALKILRNCHKVMTPGDRILVIDVVIEEENSSFRKSWMDLEMMVLLNGKERTEPEFHDLFARAGLKLNRIIPTMSDVCIVEGTL